MKNVKCFLAMVPYLRPDYPPLALPILKGSLELHGIETKIQDFNVDVYERFSSDEIKELENFCSDSTYVNHSIIKKIRKFYRYVIKKYIKDFSPDVIGISLFSFFMQRTAELFCLEIKKYNPDCKIFMGGSGVTRFLVKGQTDDWSKHIISKGIADNVIIGEGENAVVEFCKKQIKGINIVKQFKDLERNFIPNFSGIDLSKYNTNFSTDFTKNGPVVPITGSRGCVRKCSFCNVESIWPEFVFRPAEKIVDEIEEYVKKSGVRKFKFTDSLINGSSSNWREFNREIIRRGLDIEYTGQFIAKPRGQTLDSDYDIAKQAGLSKAYIGIESGSEAVRNHMKKKFDNISLFETIENLSIRGIKQTWMIITGYPTETDQDFEDTLTLLRKYKNFGTIITTSFVSFVLIPDSPIAWQDKYKDLEFYNEHPRNESMENFWICKANPSLTYQARLKRYYKVIETAIQCGYINSNVDDYKRRITNYKKQHEHQILS
jgi:radical SAM superfamily enzyme YgiQ (UPF0313 family)